MKGKCSQILVIYYIVNRPELFIEIYYWGSATAGRADVTVCEIVKSFMLQRKK